MPSRLENEASGFYEDSLPIHPPNRRERHANNRQRKQQRCQTRRANITKSVLKDVFLPTERPAQHLRNYVSGNRIAAKNHERHRPPAVVELDVGHPITDRKTNHSKARSEQHIRASPQVLVDREPDSP